MPEAEGTLKNGACDFACVPSGASTSVRESLALCGNEKSRSNSKEMLKV